MTSAYDGMGQAVDEAGEEWDGVTADNGTAAITTVFGGAVLLAVHDPDANTSTVIRLSGVDAIILAEALAAAAGDPGVSDDTETRGGWRP
jgi:hypothetical protein